MTTPQTPTAEEFDIIIIGAGSAGLTMAAVSAGLGFKVALAEGNKMGGDCLNYGCVPSKALLAAAAHAQGATGAPQFGVTTAGKTVDFKKVHAHIHNVISQIAPHDSAERFTALGVDVIQHNASFVNETTVKVGERTLTAPTIIVATGSRAFIPPVEGLANTPYFTNETIFELKETPTHLLVMGGGPIGCEMAQAFSRLGAKVTVVEMSPRILIKDDEDLTAVVEERFEDEGIDVIANTRVEKVEKTANGVRLITNSVALEGSHLLVATGRAPNLDKLNLDAAKIDHTPKGITTNKALRTSNKHVYAAGDVAGPFQFTHMAGYQAGLIIQRRLFGNFFAKTNHQAVPWVTYTDPQLAHVGLTEAQAKEAGTHKQTIKVKFNEVDRAVAERKTEGFIKVVLGNRGKVLGASIVGAHAGEILATWSFLVAHKMPLKKLASVIYPYPTFSEINKKVLSAYYAPTLYSKKTGKLSRFLFKLTQKMA